MPFVISCPHCQYSSERSANVKRHLQQAHDQTDDQVKQFQKDLMISKAAKKGNSVYECGECGRRVPSKSALDSHVHNHHRKRNDILDPADISLSDSLREPPPKKILIEDAPVHTISIQKTHKDSVQNLSTNGFLYCPFESCELHFARREHLAAHFSSEHLADSVQHLTFDSENEYKMWLRENERSTCTQFRTRSSTSESKRNVQYLVCQHEGNYASKSKKPVKKQSKKRTGEQICPAFLKRECDLNTGKISVSSYFTHYGHNLNHAMRNLNELEIQKLVNWMKDGLTNSRIMKNLTMEGEVGTRLFYTVIDDLRYIRKKYDLNEGRFNDNDLLSVEERVRRDDIDDGILHYNPPEDQYGKNFRIVIMTPDQEQVARKLVHRGLVIDDTHNSTKYGVKLTTIIVVNGSDRGIPIAFLLSTSVTESDVAVLFESIKAKIPEFHPQYFMSDEAMAFWNGFRLVFSETECRTKKLLCRWHVVRSWGQKAEELMDSEVAKTVMDTLQEIVREPNKIELDRRLATLLEFLEGSGSGGEKFAEYFRRYIRRVEEWSTVYRSGAPFHNSMYSESWHSTLKNTLLQKKTNIRLDELLQVLYDGFIYVTRCLQRQESRNLSASSARRSENLKICQRALKEEKNYLIRQMGDGNFEVQKISDGTIYTVSDSISCSCLDTENCHCSCGACYYRFPCSCLHSLAGVSCKHVHMSIKASKSTHHQDDSPIVLDSDPAPFQHFDPSVPAVDELAKTSENEEVKSRLYDESMQLMNVISQKMRKLKKDPNSDKTFLEEAFNKLQKLNESLPGSSESTLPIRRDASDPYRTARAVMNHASLPKRLKHRRIRKTPSSAPLKISKDPHLCNMCKRSEPVLPSDMDQEEFDARITEWQRCEECLLPVHWVCAKGNCPSCEYGSFVNYIPSDPSDPSGSDSDSDSDDSHAV